MLVESVIGSITLTNGKQPGPDKGDSVSEPLAHLYQGFVNASFAFLLKLDTSVRRLGRRQETERSAIQMMELQHQERGSVYCRRESMTLSKRTSAVMSVNWPALVLAADELVGERQAERRM